MRYSKGCATCRRRKIKCDESRPYCERCQRARILCEGYKRDLIWIGADRSRSKAATHEKATSLSPPRVKQKRSTPQNRGTYSHGDLQILRNLSSLSTDTFITFLVHTMPTGCSGEVGEAYQHWFTSSITEDTSTVSYVALQCLATTFFGRMHGRRRDIMAQGAALYGKALRQLHRNIADARTCYDPTNIAATMALNLYELFAYTGRMGWAQHAGGIGCLMEVRGPEAHQEYPDYGYFIISRLMVITESIVNRKRTFLEREEWQTIPWEKHPEWKTSRERLVDILCHTPGMMEDSLSIKRDREKGIDVTARRESLIATVTTLLKRLIQWRREWESSHETVAFEIVTDPEGSLTLDLNGNPLFPTLLYYSDLETVNTILLYNATFGTMFWIGSFNQCLDAVWATLEVEPDDGGVEKKNPLKLPHEVREMSDIIMEICRSVDYHLMHHQVSVGSIPLMVSLRMSFLALSVAHEIEKVKWVIRMMEIIADSSCFELSRHMFSFTRLGRSPVKVEGVTDRVESDMVKFAHSQEQAMPVPIHMSNWD